MNVRWKSRTTIVIFVCAVAIIAAFTEGLRLSAHEVSDIDRSSLTSADIPEELAPLPIAANLQPIEPALTQLATKFTAIPDFSGTTTPGQLLKITLSQSGSAARRPPVGRRPPLIGTRPPLRRPPITRRPEVSRPGRRIVNLRAISRVLDRRPRPIGAQLIDEVDCALVPNLCQDIPMAGTNLKLTNIKARVEWVIVDRNNPNVPLAEGTDFRSEKLLGLSRLFVVAPLSAAELTPSRPPANDYGIIAKVILTADKVPIVGGSGTLVRSAEVPFDVPLTLSALEVPSIFVLFLNKDFSGAAALYVPADSTLSETILPDAVRRLADTYNPVASRLNFVTWFATYLAGLRELQHTFALPHWDLKELKNQESNLNEDDFIHRGFPSTNDTEVEDESSALVMMGIPGSGVQFFQDRGFKGKRFSVETGLEMTILTRDFSNISSLPPDRICNKTYGASANDSLSSFKWIRDGSACP